MFNYYRYHIINGQYLITNEAGFYSFLSEEQFRQLNCNEPLTDAKKEKELQDQCFVIPGSVKEFSDRYMYSLRTSRQYLFHCTSLHIFVLTTACNMQCVYCQARSGFESCYGMMDTSIAEKAVDFALQSPEKCLTFEFQGGEPLLNWDILQHIVEYTEAHKGRHVVDYSVVTNLSLMTPDRLAFLMKYHVGISTSLDGNAEVHNSNRPFIDGQETFDIVQKQIHYLQEQGVHVGAIETTTRKGLQYSKELIDVYYAAGLHSVFIRPLTPLGYAVNNWKKIGYTPEEFLIFYKKCFEYIMEMNLRGIFMREGHAAIFLRKILCQDGENYMELRTPCGGVTGQIAYFYNGDIYTCDEGRMLGEMGDQLFRLGNVCNDTFDKVICSSACQAMMAASCLESVPECSDCAYLPYCGTCPVLNYSEYGDIFPSRPGGYKCRIYKGMLDILFEFLSRNDEHINRVLRSWIA